MTTLGASLIVKNEETMLEDCLKSIQGVDEIVILDTGSTDKTGEIARKYTDKYIEGVYTWNDNFAEARNKALDYNTTEWIFALDSDERLDPGGIEKIRKLIDAGTDNGLEALNIIMYNKYPSASENEFYSPRVFKRNIPEHRFIGRIHECIVFPWIPMLCDHIRMSFQAHNENTFERNIRIIESELRQDPDNLRLWYVAGREYFLYQYYPAAIYSFERYKRNQIPWGFEYADAMYTLAMCFYRMGEIMKAQELCLEAIKVNADFKDAFALMKACAEKQKDIPNQKHWGRMYDQAQNEGLTFKKKFEIKKEGGEVDETHR